MIIAIDGTVSSGKSTAAKNVARELGLLYINTGLMYRAVAAYCLNSGVDTADKEKVASLAKELTIDLVNKEDGQHVLANGEDLTTQCKGPAVAKAVSDVADNVEVRKHLVAEQRRLGLAAKPGAVMEGRDIGSVVFPDADIKFFITAPAEVRAHRRCLEFKENGKNVPEEEVLRSVLERDKRDRERPVGALIQLPEAIPLDTGDLTREEVTQKIVEHVNAARS
jgi:cytidylate kinase